MLSTTSRRLSSLLPVLLSVVSGCATYADRGEPMVVELDGKADGDLRLDLEQIDIFRITCPLEACRFRLDLPFGAPVDSLHFAVGSLDEMSALRDQVLAGSGPDGELPGRVAVVDGETVVFLDVAEGDQFGIAYAAEDAPAGFLEVRMSLVPGPDFATPLPARDVGQYAVASVVEDERHRWSVSMLDAMSSRHPEVQVVMDGNALDLELYVTYRCTAEGSTEEAGVVFALSQSQSVTFVPDCLSVDDTGAIYIEVAGDWPYMLSVALAQ